MAGSQFRTVETLFTPEIWDVSTTKTPAVQVAPKRHIAFINVWLCFALLFAGVFIGIGVGRTVMAGAANTVTYCSGGVCVQRYHDTCSDWWQIQNGNKP